MNSCPDVDTDPRPAVEFKCRSCGVTAKVCRSCWHNQRYCSEPCRAKGLRERKHRNQKKYRATKAGREANLAAQRRYRLH